VLGRARHFAARTVPAPPAAMQREPIRLSVETVLAMSRIRGLRAIAGDERRQTIAIALVRRSARRRSPAIGLLLARLMLLIGLGLAPLMMLLLPRRIGLGLARRVGLMLRFAAEWRVARMVLLGVFQALVARLAFRTEIRLALPELLLSRGDQPEIMLGVLVLIFRGDGVAGRQGIAGELDVFFRDVRGRSADFHVGTV
jgi:hypothetical protein